MAQSDCRVRCKCRPGRPNCRRSRALWDRPCQCDGYHFPHRRGSKLCEHSATATEARNLLMYGTG